MVLNQIKLISIATFLGFTSLAIASQPSATAGADTVAATASAVMTAVKDGRPDSPIPASLKKPVVPKLPLGMMEAYAAEDAVGGDLSDLRAAFAAARLDRAAMARAGVEALARVSDSDDDSDCSNKAVRVSDSSPNDSVTSAAARFGRVVPASRVARPADAACAQRPSVSSVSSMDNLALFEEDDATAQV